MTRRLEPSHKLVAANVAVAAGAPPVAVVVVAVEALEGGF